ncbi:hypothetical protein AVEN_14521-1 [Araneus ventricosus]|uniref:Integrase catalytic domain-containing protein n=1 Tax=Araneus ventricosus TaxID=182803 RepID=A0A4Y2CGY5_ARAVE|nr:hypothetical protein AVEN_14521-1 [Araneus ventricosus]
MRKDFENFRYPIVLASDHIVVQKMIMHKHKTLSQCGVQTLMFILREEFWILKSRRTIRKAIKTCTVCRRFEAKHPEVQAAPLPEDRLRDSATFETTGIDLAGPLYLRDGSKSWVVLYTCAVYRAVHLELVTSLTTDKFLLSLRRFISRRGRPSIIYTDKGSNFKGSNQALNKVDWNKINDDTSVSRIQWKFIPPSSPWWGGFWERLIGLLKTILRKVLGKASLRKSWSLVKIRTKQGDLLRPIQRLYPLEVSSPNDGDLRKLIEGPTICEKSECDISSDPSSLVPDSGEELSPTPVPQRVSRYGRTLRVPRRLNL